MKSTFTRDVIKNVGVIRLTKSNKDLMLEFYDNMHHYYISLYESDIKNNINLINAKKFEDSNFTGVTEIIDLALMLANNYIKYAEEGYC